MEFVNNPQSRKQDKYHDFETKVKRGFQELVNNGVVLFKTNVSQDAIWNAYLNGFPEWDGRDHYNCNACRHFIQRYGALAYIGSDGLVKSVLWDIDVPPYFINSTQAMKSLVEKSRISNVFITDDLTLGIPKTGEWSHIHVVLPLGHSAKNRDRLYTAEQVMAKKKEQFGMLGRALNEYDEETIDQAINILESNSLYRGDRYLGTVKWFKETKETYSNLTGPLSKNFLWATVATAGDAKLHIKSSMLGGLMDDIQSGLYSFDTIKRRFEERINPSNYMRSQSAPTTGAIKEAEKTVAKLGIANSLQRRYATIDEIPESIWTPREEKKATSNSAQGIFSNLIAKDQRVEKKQDIVIPSTTMTWDKFVKTVLPGALSIEAQVESANNLMALVNAQDQTAENILLWDNTFSWYYHGGIDAEIKKRVESAGGQYENNDIRCSLLWNSYTDLDLHCHTPRGNHIHFGKKRADNGWLDIDMNVSADTKTPVENIRFGKGLASRGRYRFVVHNYTDRTGGYNPYKVELEVNGHVYTYEGVADSRCRETVFEFDFIPGEEPRMISSGSSLSTTPVDNWNIDKGFQKVNLITNSPNLWGDNKVESAGTHIFFILDNCKDMSEGKGRGFFNEMLIPELRPHRKTLEAFMEQSIIEGANEANACGLGFSKEKPWNLVLRVKTSTGTKLVKIDRWD